MLSQTLYTERKGMYLRPASGVHAVLLLVLGTGFSGYKDCERTPDLSCSEIGP